jgi:hypothetical protein
VSGGSSVGDRCGWRGAGVMNGSDEGGREGGGQG